jgi:uncharacterized protein with HEPN domain
MWLKNLSGTSAFSRKSTRTAPLPSERPALRLQDIIDNINAIFLYTAGMNVERFENDHKTYDAVERCLERVSEAAAKLGDLAAILMPEQPWRQIRALGNRLRHEYGEIRPDRLWDIIQSDLPPLGAACQTALQRLRDSDPV